MELGGVIGVDRRELFARVHNKKRGLQAVDMYRDQNLVSRQFEWDLGDVAAPIKLNERKCRWHDGTRAGRWRARSRGGGGRAGRSGGGLSKSDSGNGGQHS